MRRYTKDELEVLLNWDKLHCKPPFKNSAEECQHYARFIERMLWAYLEPKDWQRLEEIINDIRVPEKQKRATVFLIKKHLS